jgi:hypothetical protein
MHNQRNFTHCKLQQRQLQPCDQNHMRQGRQCRRGQARAQTPKQIHMLAKARQVPLRRSHKPTIKTTHQRDNIPPDNLQF